MNFKVMVLIGLAFTINAAFAASTWVDPYQRRDGTVVKGHFKTKPDGVRGNNYGFGNATNWNDLRAVEFDLETDTLDVHSADEIPEYDY